MQPQIRIARFDARPPSTEVLAALGKQPRKGKVYVTISQSELAHLSAAGLLPGHRLFSPLGDMSFAGLNLDFVWFTHLDGAHSFDGASLVGAVFTDQNHLSRCTFAGADLTGTRGLNSEHLPVESTAAWTC